MMPYQQLKTVQPVRLKNRLQLSVEVEGTQYTLAYILDMKLDQFKQLVSFIESEKDLMRLYKALDDNAADTKAAYVQNLLDSL